MKNLLKILLVLAFANPVFASSTSTTQWPDPASVTTAQIAAMSTADQTAWVASLTMDQYKMLSAEVQEWVVKNTTPDQQKTLGITQ